MTSTQSDNKPTFRAGDEVVLAQGTFPGTKGVFLRLKKDLNSICLN